MEIFKPITGYEGIYEVSNCGNVKRVCYFDNASKNHFDTGVNLKLNVSKLGYQRIKLMLYGKPKMHFVHRLVGNEFCKKPIIDKLLEINHIDGNKQNNNFNNLEWVTKSENMQHAFDSGLNNLKNKKGSRQVYMYTKDNVFIRSFASTHEVERQLKFSQRHIQECCVGKLKTAYGYKWSYDKGGE